MMARLSTLAPVERENDEATRLVRPAPKNKPPRHDRRRERMNPDRDPDTDEDADLKSKDRSRNYKTIGGSVAERVALRYAAKGGRIGRIPARSKETGKVVFVSEKTLRENPDKYEKYKPEKETPRPEAGGQAAPEEKPKPPRPRPKKAPAETPPQQTQETQPPPGEVAPPAGAEAPVPKEKAKRKKKGPKKQEGEKPNAEGETPEGPKSEDSKGEDPKGQAGKGTEAEKPKRKPVADELGIKRPQQREVTAAERGEASLLLADHLPPKLAARLISSKMHPDDAKAFVDNYRAAKSRPLGNPTDFADKVSKIYETNPDRVPPPTSWRTADGKKVPFESLSPEEKSAAYHEHQLQVVATSVAAKDQLEEKLSFGGVVSKAAAEHLTRALLGGVKEKNAKSLGEQVFNLTANAKGAIKIPDGMSKKMLAAVEGNDVAKHLLVSYLEGNDYKRAKDLYLGKGALSESDNPKALVDGLRSARDFFKVQAQHYGTGEGHEGSKRFETKALTQLRKLEPEKYKAVRLGLDREDAREYDKAKRQHEKASKAFDAAYAAWQKRPFRAQEPKPPKAPVEPAGYSNAKDHKDLQADGRKLWDDLHDRSETKKTAAQVASKFLISSYLAGTAMDRTQDTRAKLALYHGVDPGAHYPSAPYPGWGPVPSRQLAEGDYATILESAKAWLPSTRADGGVPDTEFRAALDLSLATGPYKVDIQTYGDLLARLQGVTAPGLAQNGPSIKQAVDRGKLEHAIYKRFPPDSKLKSGGTPTVMLTGNTASKLKRPDFTTVALRDLSLPELTTLAKTMKIVTSTFAPAPGATGRHHFPRKPDNGARQMLRLSSEQKTSANQILANFDQLALQIQENYKKWGMPREAAKDIVNRLDRTADAAETLMFGEASLQARQAEIAVQSQDFVQDTVDAGLLTRGQVAKAAKVIQRESDEPYMETFKNPMKPLETDSDEPYMSAYGDDQSSAVIEGEDDTGRDLAPEA